MFCIKSFLTILCAIALASCNTFTLATHWQERSNFSAPMLFDGIKGQAFWRCALIQNPSGGPCQIGFKDHNNKMILLDEIESEIESYASIFNINRSYQFFILTYSPTVIMFVPGQPRLGKQCSGENYVVGCFSTSKIPNANFQYGPRPEVGRGSYLFAPIVNSAPMQIPDEVTQLEFKLPDSTLELTPDGSYWRVLRLRRE